MRRQTLEIKEHERYFENLKKLEALASQKCEAHLKINKEYAEVMGAEADKADEEADESQAQNGVGAEVDEADEGQRRDIDMVVAGAEESPLL